MILYQPNWFTKIVFSWKLWVLGSWFWRQNDRKTIPYNPPFDGSVHRARFHNFISYFIKEGCCFGTNFSGIQGVFGPNGGLGSQDSVEKVSWKVYTKQKIFTQNPKIIFYHIFACVRAEEEKLKLMLQLDEVQLRLKSVEFRKPVTKRIQHKSHDTSWFHLIILENKSLRITQSFKTRWQ